MQNETEIRIVPMNASHIAEIAEIERQCFSEPWSEKSLAEELNVPSAVFLTALAGGRVAGYMGVHHLGDSAYVCNVAVPPEFRRKKVASALIGAQIAKAVEAGMSELTLEVRTSNIPARSLYEKFGFDHIGTRPDFYSAPKENAEIYTLVIDRK
ncbi:MAG: ribosomal protein S18-alanine N-acetyltransferase [Clostridia bacterium]|nr:ribosomal protein S18-alanine N-acetyltransferase [Clostridia bacterium]